MKNIAKNAPNSNLNPSAWIVTNNRKDKTQSSDKGRKSVKKGKVYLNDGEEFEIELFNPLHECILCDIKLNGQSISKSGLVLKPGQRFYLDCFIDDKKKFVFKTYDVDDTIESNNAISKNGLLEVYFYKEEVVNIYNWNNRFNKLIVERYYPIWYYPVYYPWITYGTAGHTTTGTFTLNNTSTNTIVTDTATTNCVIGSNANYTTTNLNIGSGGSQYSNSAYYNSSNSIETGRIEKGSKSGQKFDNIDMEFESSYLTHTIIQMLPNSRKPIDVAEISPSFCHECGSKIKSKFKFCPTCGGKLN